MMRSRRVGLMLSAAQLWYMSLPFRLYFKPLEKGYAPGLRNLLRYECRKLRHTLYERDRLGYVVEKLRHRLRLR